jgi:thioredoxin-related protein
MKRIIAVLSVALLTVGMMSFKSTPPKVTPKIEWITLEEAYKRNLRQPRKIYIDLYTEWCGWCKVMDKNTFTNPEVAELITQKYYAVKYNPEVDSDVMLGKVSFRKLIEGNVQGYPTSFFMDEKYNMIQSISSYFEPRTFHQIIAYFGDEANKKEKFDDYVKGSYQTKYPKKPSAIIGGAPAPH